MPPWCHADFYGASALLPLSDQEIVDRLKSHIATCEPGFKDANVIDSAVLRFPKAVTHFSPGSYTSRPYQVTGIPNCFLAGDWVKGVSVRVQFQVACTIAQRTVTVQQLTCLQGRLHLVLANCVSCDVKESA